MVEIAASRSRSRAAVILAASAALASAAAGFSFSFSAVFAAISQFSSMLWNLGQTVKSRGSEGNHETHETHEKQALLFVCFVYFVVILIGWHFCRADSLSWLDLRLRRRTRGGRWVSLRSRSEIRFGRRWFWQRIFWAIQQRGRSGHRPW